MGNRIAMNLVMEKAPITTRDSVNCVLKTVCSCLPIGSFYGLLSNALQIDKATREETSGTFQSYDGSVLSW